MGVVDAELTCCLFEAWEQFTEINNSEIGQINRYEGRVIVDLLEGVLRAAMLPQKLIKAMAEHWLSQNPWLNTVANPHCPKSWCVSLRFSGEQGIQMTFQLTFISAIYFASQWSRNLDMSLVNPYMQLLTGRSSHSTLYDLKCLIMQLCRSMLLSLSLCLISGNSRYLTPMYVSNEDNAGLTQEKTCCQSNLLLGSIVLTWTSHW